MRMTKLRYYHPIIVIDDDFDFHPSYVVTVPNVSGKLNAKV